jgi:hypothetical protein
MLAVEYIAALKGREESHAREIDELRREIAMLKGTR